MANRLKNMKLTSVDLCGQGANPDADIRLLKSEDGGPRGLFRRLGELFLKAATENGEPPAGTDPQEMIRTAQDCCGDLSKSMESILADSTLTAAEKVGKVAESLQDFSAEITENTNAWFGEETPPPVDKSKKGVEKELIPEIEKMSREDQISVYEELKKKYGTPEGEPSGGEGSGDPAPDPNLKKAMDEIAELKKSLELQQLTNVAKKYEPLGKKADELAEIFKGLKAVGGDAYQNYVSLLDEMLSLQESTGLFSEFGKSGPAAPGALRESDAFEKARAKAAELRKARPELTQAQAIDAVITEDPELAKALM